MKQFKPLPRTKRLYTEKGVSPEEMILGDVVQSFAAAGFRPSESGSGHCFIPAELGAERVCTACALTALVGHEAYENIGNNDVPVTFEIAYGWDTMQFQPHDRHGDRTDEATPAYTAGFAAWEAMRTSEAEALEESRLMGREVIGRPTP